MTVPINPERAQSESANLDISHTGSFVGSIRGVGSTGSGADLRSGSAGGAMTGSVVGIISTLR
ncbi:hypothetical protein [Gordonia effusa]|uniref:hypothetical protein n=1 Tax=Gordonia effusa TaxID=263908 RepID=UPI00031EBD6C|nr:hypothetical protein [Gordonia effusa]